MIEESVLQRTLQTALARTAATSPRCSPRTVAVRRRALDDGKVEELVSGRERGAGIRVVRGETTGFAHTADLSRAGLAAAAEAAAAAARGTEAGHARRRRSSAGRWRRPTRSQVLPETVAKARKVEVLERADARRPRR